MYSMKAEGRKNPSVHAELLEHRIARDLQDSRVSERNRVIGANRQTGCSATLTEKTSPAEKTNDGFFITT